MSGHMSMRIETTELSAEGPQHIFAVQVLGSDTTHTYTVSLDDEYYTVLGEQNGMTREELIKRAFGFLLERESAEEILPEFDLRDINDYFPEFEDELIK